MTKVRTMLVGCLCVGFLSSTVLAFNLPSASDLTKAATQDAAKTDSEAAQVNSDKVVIQKSARVGKNVVKFAVGGAVVGAAVGALSGDKKDRAANAIKGALPERRSAASPAISTGPLKAKSCVPGIKR